MSASHQNYPAFTYVFPDDGRRARALQPFFAAAVRDAIRCGDVYGAVDDGTVVGIAVWLPPNCFPWTPMRKLRITWPLLRVCAAYPSRFPTFVRLGAAVETMHPTGPHWSLEALGVRPEYQRSGLGSRLIEPALERVDAEGLDCYLETSDPANVEYYRRFGFQVEKHLQLIPDGPPHVAMRRPAGRTDSGGETNDPEKHAG